MQVYIHRWSRLVTKDAIVIIGYGITSDNESIAIRIHDFNIFFYVSVSELLSYYQSSDVLQIINHFNKTKKHIRKYSINRYKTLRRSLKEPRAYVKFEFDHMSSYKEVCSELKNKGITLIENDIPVEEMFITKLKISTVGWIEVSGCDVDFDMRISKVTKEIVASVNDVFGIAKGNIPQDPTLVSEKGIAVPLIVCMDIEVYSSNHRTMPDPYLESDQVFMVSLISQRYQQPESRCVYLLYVSKQELDLDVAATVKHYHSEEECLKGYFNLIDELDPDVITGYNFMGFDYTYMNTRLDRRLYEIPNSSRIRRGEVRVKEINWQSSAYGFNKYILFDMDGRSSIDIYQYISKEYKLQQYKLSYVSNKFLGDTKLPLSTQTMFELYAKGDSKSISEIAQYCIQDSILVMRLFDRMNLWISFTEMANIMRVDITDLYTRGQQLRVRAQLYKECKQNNILLDKIKAVDHIEYQGAIVIEPVPGLYDWCMCLDFTSLYPSIIISNNICYSTLADDRYKDDDCHCVTISRGEHEIVYRFVKHPIGIVPQLLDKLLSNRSKIKKQMESSGGHVDILLYERQKAYKLSANSVYGSYGTRNSEYLQFIPGAESTTALGRKYIQQACNEIIHNGAKLIYGDTDSCIIQKQFIDNASLCETYAKDIANTISGLFPTPIRLEYENTYKRFLLITKKRYSAMTSNGKMIYKGIVVSRRDNCSFLRATYSELIQLIMTNNSTQTIESYLNHKLDQLWNGLVVLDDLIIRRTLNKNYKNKSNPQYIYARQLLQEGLTMVPGDRMEFVFVRVQDKDVLQGYRMCHPDRLGSSEIDYKYYIKNHLQKPIDQLLTLVGLGKLVDKYFQKHQHPLNVPLKLN